MNVQRKILRNNIAQNSKARHEYFIKNKFEAGLVLEGWEVRSLRHGLLSLNEAYIVMDLGEAWLHGAHISPLLSASTHVYPNNIRQRKLLLHSMELSQLISAVDRKGYTIVPLSMYWNSNRVKIKIALAKGKRYHDKRATEKNRDWSREKARIFLGKQ
ncbi:MAG: SsrA-binding protein SmpB [Piscirickettsiaceae bacterium]|nr:SsrA-binding protein SmpB [Piscirickettsiaceae bacterium]